MAASARRSQTTGGGSTRGSRGRRDLLCLAAGYAWLAAGLVAFGLSEDTRLMHLITVGALGTLTFNVMALSWLLRARRAVPFAATHLRRIARGCRQRVPSITPVVRIADLVAPPVPVRKQSDRYFIHELWAQVTIRCATVKRVPCEFASPPCCGAAT